MNTKWIEGGLVIAILIVVASAFAQTWTQPVALVPNREWGAIAESADGIKIMAAGSAFSPAISTNSGVTWRTNTIYNSFTWIAVSADGEKCIAVFSSSPTKIFASTDSGITWLQTSSPSSSSWSALAMSAGGNKLYGAINGGLIYTSTNFGTNWTATGAPNKQWVYLASSADGIKLAAAPQNDSIYTSTNAGATWAKSGQNNSWTSIASTADGNRLVAAGSSGTYLSTNAGGTWELVNTNNGQVATSADGKRLTIAGNAIYTSDNFGTTWVSNSVPVKSASSAFFLNSVASSADGCKLFALRINNAVWTYQTNITPDLKAVNMVSNMMFFSWLLPSTRYVLQQNTDLSTTNWVTVTNAPLLNLTNLHQEILLPKPGSAGFYRLMTQ